ncbi:hypothetical protein VS84_00418 [Vibrio cholerae]|nr:hypothetical protein VS84_00418 [Vibrio cholerae]KKP21730.1 hypothetical protein VS86_00379 [Vibrio cholerae]
MPYSNNVSKMTKAMVVDFIWHVFDVSRTFVIALPQIRFLILNFF